MEAIPQTGQGTAQPTEQGSKVNLTNGIIHNHQCVGFFSFAHLHVRSIMNKLDHLKILMSKNPFDIICLNETFCDDSIADNEISLPDYSIERKDRNRHGGGVAMYIRNNLTFVRRIDLETDDVECIWVEIKCKHRQPVLMSSIYRPPSRSVEFIGKLSDIIDRASSECKEIIVTGDFNFDVSEADNSGTS